MLGTFQAVLAMLREAGYVVECRMLDAQWLGVPQARRRLIFVGVRDDLAAELGPRPTFPDPLPWRYSIADACPWLAGAKSVVDPRGEFPTTERGSDEAVQAIVNNRVSQHRVVVPKGGHGFHEDRHIDVDQRAPTLLSSDGARAKGPRIETTSVRVAIGNEAFEPTFGAPDVPSPTIMKGGPCDSSGWVEEVRLVVTEGGHGKFDGRTIDPRSEPMPSMRVGASGEMRVALVDGAGDAHRRSRTQVDGPTVDGYALARHLDKLTPGETSSTRLNMTLADPRDPSPAIVKTGGHGGTSGVVIERRKFTILELKRLCSFPDDFALGGAYAKQLARLGNAVPPLMMRAVATALRDRVFARLAQRA